MKQLVFGVLMVAIAACSSEQPDQEVSEISPETQQEMEKEEAYQLELDAIDRELDSLMEAN